MGCNQRAECWGVVGIGKSPEKTDEQILFIPKFTFF